MTVETKNIFSLSVKSNHFWSDAFLIVLGALLQSIAYAVFIAPANIVPGGVYGLSISINYMTRELLTSFPSGLPVGIVALCFNIPLFLLSAYKLGLKSGGKTIATFLLIAFLTDLTTWLTKGVALVENDPFLASVYGGAVLGLGVFFTFKAQSTSAGTDSIARILAKGRNIKVSTLLILIDSIVVVVGLLAFGDWKVPLYSWITIFVYGKVVDVLQPENPNKAVFIVSDKSSVLQPILARELNLRGTVVQGQGIYAGEGREIIFMIVERKDISRLKKSVLHLDPKAFIATTNATNDTIPTAL